MRLSSLPLACLQYYNDFVLAFDTMEKKWSRVGVLPCQPNNRHLRQLSILVMACVCVCCADGCITSHCGTNGTHVICIGGEPRHGHNGNAESVVQIGRITELTV